MTTFTEQVTPALLRKLASAIERNKVMLQEVLLEGSITEGTDTELASFVLTVSCLGKRDQLDHVVSKQKGKKGNK